MEIPKCPTRGPFHKSFFRTGVKTLVGLCSTLGMKSNPVQVQNECLIQFHKGNSGRHGRPPGVDLVSTPAGMFHFDSFF